MSERNKETWIVVGKLAAIILIGYVAFLGIFWWAYEMEVFG